MSQIIKHNFKNNSFEGKFNEIYFSSLEKIQNSTEYKDTENRIDFYKKILKSNYKINPELLENLVSSIEEKVELEYESAIKNSLTYIDAKLKI